MSLSSHSRFPQSMREPFHYLSERGFTLVELMIVVAIIGLLSAIAVPNFRKYQAKTKITEAKLQLANAYTAEAAFFAQYNMYSNCLRYMGYDPFEETSSRFYGIGFLAEGALTNLRNAVAQASAETAGLSPTECPNTTVVVQATANNPTATWFGAGRAIGNMVVDTAAKAGASGINPSLGDQSSAANMTYEISAHGIISANSPTYVEASALTINQAKQIVIHVNGF